MARAAKILIVDNEPLMLESEHMIAIQALRESEERFRSLIENSLTGVCIIQDDKVVYQNPEQKRLFGPLPESISVAELDFIYPDDIEEVSRCYEELLSDKAQTVEAEFRFRPFGFTGRPSPIKWVYCRACSFLYQGRDAILVNMMDITHTKELEKMMTIKNKMACLGRVAAGVAHEIRNPLTGINSYIYSLENICNSKVLEEEDFQAIAGITAEIQASSNKIESVIKRVLDFSKPNMINNMTLTDINKPVMDAVKLSMVSLRKNGIEIATFLATGLPRCEVDIGLIEQVILNLINNAAKALEEVAAFKKIEIKTYSKTIGCI